MNHQIQANIIAIMFIIAIACFVWAAWKRDTRWIAIGLAIFVFGRLFPALDVFWSIHH